MRSILLIGSSFHIKNRKAQWSAWYVPRSPCCEAPSDSAGVCDGVAALCASQFSQVCVGKRRAAPVGPPSQRRRLWGVLRSALRDPCPCLHAGFALHQLVPELTLSDRDFLSGISRNMLSFSCLLCSVREFQSVSL